jgi:hypothetical protein
MSRQSEKIVKGAREYLDSGEEVLAALVAAARGHTQAVAGSMNLGAHQQGTAGAAAAEAGLQIASPMGVALTNRRLLTLRIGTPIGLGIGGAVKDLLSAVPITDVEAIEVKRLALGYTIALTVRGSTFKLEANAASGAPALAEAFEQVRGVRA